MVFLEPFDLTLFAPNLGEEMAEVMIEDAEALALRAAPCLGAEAGLSASDTAAVRAILRGAILRWHESGAGALQAETIGPFSQTFDTRQARRGMFWPSEITQLQDICRTGSGDGAAFSIDTTPEAVSTVHLDTCAIRFGGGCSCGGVFVDWGMP